MPYYFFEVKAYGHRYIVHLGGCAQCNYVRFKPRKNTLSILVNGVAPIIPEQPSVIEQMRSLRYLVPVEFYSLEGTFVRVFSEEEARQRRRKPYA